MRRLPTGTVTFLFTDIEGSTRLLADVGAQAYARALAEHRRILRQAFANHGGVEVDTQGDAFFVAFATAPGALDAAREAQSALAVGPVRVRMGIHTGTPLSTDDGYVGADVHRAARIAAVGHGGQVLVSASTAALVGVEGLRDLGEHRLKDLSAPERIYQLGHDEFAPLKSLYRTNLPVPSTPFLGREVELTQVVELLANPDVRLVTLTGPGGTGKTRLGLQAAAAAADAYPDGVWWVPLAPVRDAELVLATAARALGAEGDPAEHIADRRTLVVLDNFEHLPEAARDVAELLERCPKLDVLVTSRTPLRLAGEWEVSVDPLRDAEAIELFTQRALAVRQRLQPTPAVAEICRRLDRLPLALELAAARLRVLSPEELLERLAHRLPVLTGGALDAPERQRTLRATIEWSCDLLSPEERRLFARLAVFAGGFTLASAEEVCEADLDTVERLVESSLIRRWESGRLGMLETVREYAEEQLEGSAEREAVRRRHAEHFLRLAESANLSVEALGRGPQRQVVVLPEQDNLRAAIDWATEHDVELALRLLIALENFWITQDAAEGTRRFEAALDRAEGLDLELRARAMRDYGATMDIAGDNDRAMEAGLRSRELFREAGDERGVAEMTFRIGVVTSNSGDATQARRLFEESLEAFRRLGDSIGEFQALYGLGWIEVEHGDRQRGIELIEQSLAKGADVGWTWWQAGLLVELALFAVEAGRFAEAEERALEALRVARAIDDRSRTLMALLALARVALGRGEAERASALWGGVLAEEERAPTDSRWRDVRDQHASGLRDLPRPHDALGLEDAVKLATASD